MSLFIGAPGGGNWSAAASWLVAGVPPAAPPTAADDVQLTVASGAVTVTAASVCRSLDMTGYASTLSGSGDLSIGDASGGACTLAGTLSGVWTVTFKSTSNNGGTGWSITSNGKAFPNNVGFNGVGGKWVCQDAFSVGAFAITVNSGAFFGNGQTITAAILTMNGSGVRTTDLTNCAVTLSSGGSAWSSTGSNLTLTTTGSTITFTGSGATFSVSSANSFASLVFSGAGIVTTAQFSSCVNFTRTGTALKTDRLDIQGIFTVTGTLTLGGNTTQGVNRLLVQSSVVGTQRTIDCTGAAVVISGDVDFMDIAITGSPSWTNAGSAFVGDALGNGTLITTNRTAPATQTHTTSAGGNWSDPTKWTSRVPLPQDNVIVNGSTTGTLTGDMPRLGADLTFTGFAGTCVLSSGNHSVFGSLALASGMTMTTTSAGFWFYGRGSHTITSAGKSIGEIDVAMLAPGGTYTLADALTLGLATTGALYIEYGTFNANGKNVTASGFNFITPSTATRVVNMGAGTWTALTATGNVWNCSSDAATTINHQGSTIAVSAASTATRTFIGGGKSYGTLTYTVAGSTGQLTITGANTFTAINFSDASNARTLAFTAATTTTITGMLNVGSAAQVMTMRSTVGGSAAIVVGPWTVANVSVQDITGSPSGATYALDSTNVSGNTGIIFSPPDMLPSVAQRSNDRGVLSRAALNRSTRY